MPRNWALACLEQLHSGAYGELAQCGVYALDAVLGSPAGDTNALMRAISESHRMMAAAGTDRLRWREFYTDASIVLALTKAGRNDVTEELAKEAIAHLDMAIIIAGAPVHLDLIHALILDIQAHHLGGHPGTETEPYERSFDSQRLPSVVLPSAAAGIPEPEEAPSLSAFRKGWASGPFILRGFVQDWPALTDHPWSSPQYLRSISGAGRVVPVEVGNDYRADDWKQEILPFDAFLDALCRSDEASPTYLAQYNLLRQFPRLRDDIAIPDYVYASPDPTPDFPGYEPPTNEDQLVTNVWLGPKGTVSPAHTDPYFNLYAQVVGSKTVWVAPPSVSAHMLPYPPPSTTSSPTGVSSQPPHNPAVNSLNPTMSNTSSVDVFDVSSQAPSETDPNDERLQDFWGNAVPRAMSATLNPGDLLFLPPGWWHAMRSETVSFSVSMWF